MSGEGRHTVTLILVLALLLALPVGAAASAAPEAATAQVFHADPLDPSVGRARFVTYALRDKDGTRVLVANGPAPYRTDIKHGDRVLVSRVAASKGKGKAVAGWSIAPLMQRAALAAPAVGGNHRFAAIMIAFADAQAPTWMTQAQMRLSLFDDPKSVSAWFREASYGLLNITGDVYGPVTIPLSRVGCPYASAGSYADQAVIARIGVAQFAEYQHIFYIFTGGAGCPWAGLSTVGGSPSRAWAGGDSDVTTHEWGHSLGLWHSHSLLCIRLSACSPGQVAEYGDTLDVMGSGGGKRHFNAAQKAQYLGWLGAPGAPPVTTVTANGTYSVDAYETPGALSKALRIPAPSGDVFYVEARRAATEDATTRAGVLVHLRRGGSADRVYLLDMTPDSPDWGRPALPVGATFTDPASRISITLASATPAGATVAVGGLAGGPPPPPPPPGCPPNCPPPPPPPPPPQPTCPPDCDPPPAGDVTLAFTYENTGKPQTFQVPEKPAPPVCERVTGGTRQLRIWQGGRVVRSVTVDNPNPKGEAFSIRCFVNGASITGQLRVNGVLKATVSR